MALVRDRIVQSKIYKTILWITLLSMAGGSLLFTPNLFKRLGSGDASAIVTVNGQTITTAQLEQKTLLEFERIALLRQQFGQYADSFLRSIGMDNPQAMALQNLITETLLNEVSDMLGLRIAPHYITQKLKSSEFVVKELRDVIPLKALTQDGAINTAFLKYYLQKQRLSFADFEKAIECALKRKVVANIIKSATYISQGEIDAYLIASFAKKNFSMVKIVFKDMLKQAEATELSLSELESYFNQENKRNKRYWVPEKRTAEIFTFTPENYGITIDMKDVETYYAKNKQKFIARPAQVQIRRILLEVKDSAELNNVYQLAQSVREELLADPSKFAQRAKEISQDTQTALNGGLMDFFAKGQKDPSFERAAFRLESDGQISDIVNTQYGLEILQRVSRKKPEYKAFDSVKKEIEIMLMAQKFEELFLKDMKNKFGQHYNKQNFDSFVHKKQATQKLIADQIKEKKSSDLVQKIFKAKIGTPSYFIEDNGKGIVVMLIKETKTYEPSFDQVKDMVKNDLYTQRAETLIDTLMATIKHNAKQVGLAAAAAQEKINSDILGPVSAQDAQELDALAQKGIPVTKMLAMSTPGSIITFKDAKYGYMLQLNSVEPLDAETIKQKRAEALKALEQEKEMLVYRGYIASLFRNAKIKSVNENSANNEQLPLEELPQ